jgi:hypothetical protein
MKLFYKNLARGSSKDEALQQAKIEFIKEADDIRQNPAFWAGFVMMGNTSPIHHETFFQKYLIYLVISCLLLAGIYFRDKIFVLFTLYNKSTNE